MSEHSKLPWSYGIGNQSHEIYEAGGALVARLFENVQDRFLIVDACNNYDTLRKQVEIAVNAMKQCLSIIKDVPDEHPYTIMILEDTLVRLET